MLIVTFMHVVFFLRAGWVSGLNGLQTVQATTYQPKICFKNAFFSCWLLSLCCVTFVIMCTLSEILSYLDRFKGSLRLG